MGYIGKAGASGGLSGDYNDIERRHYHGHGHTFLVIGSIFN